MYFIKTKDGTMLHFDKSGHGKAIYFFHPPALGASVFAEQMPLAKDHKLVALNARGHGLSGVGKEPLTMKRWAQDVKQLADAEKDDKIIVCGYSCGSLPALEFALAYPECTQGLILIGGFPVVDTILLEREFQLGVWAAKHRFQPLMSAVLSNSHTHHRKTRRKIKQTVGSVRSDVLAKWYKAGKEADYSLRLKKLRAPLLLVYGIHDRYVQGYQTTFYEQVTRASVDTVYINDVGHQVPTRRSKEFNTIVRKFSHGTL